MSVKARILTSENLSYLFRITAKVIMFVAVLSITNAAAQKDPERKVIKPEIRRQWFYQQRAFPNLTIPKGAMHRARQYSKQSLSPMSLADAPPVPGYVWEQIGPAPTGPTVNSIEIALGPTSARIRSIAVDNPSIIYIGAASGGVWKTVNGGSSWIPLTDDQPSLSMGSVAIDPSNSNILYAGTGEYGGIGPATYGAGLLKSTDGGNSWSHIPGPWDTLQGGSKINKVLIIPGPNPLDSNDEIVFVAGSSHLFRSALGGTDFNSSSTPVLEGNISDIVVDPTNTNNLYAASHSEGIYRSMNGGIDWDSDLVNPGVDPIWAPGTTSSGCSILRGALAIAPTDADVLYAAFQTDKNCVDGTGNMFKTTNARDTAPVFNQLPTPRYPAEHVYEGVSWCRSQCWYDLALIVQPTDPDGAGPLEPKDIVYVGGVGFFRSTDGGETWTNLGESPTWVHVDLHAFAFDSNGALYVGSDGGIYRHPNPATALSADLAWVELNNNLAITQFYPGISINPNTVEVGSTLILGGTQDNGVQRCTGQKQWDSVLSSGDGAYTAFDFTNPGTWYISTQYCRIYKTTNNGPDLYDITTLPRGNTLFIAPLVMCPDNSQVLIASNDFGVWRTNDGANTWVDNSPDLASYYRGTPSALAFVPGTNCNTYFAAGETISNGINVKTVFRTMGGGGISTSDWDDISGNLPNRHPTDIAVHPSQNNIIYVTFSGFCGNNDTCPANEGHVWVTTNAYVSPSLVTWTDLTGGKGLPNIPVNAIAIDSAYPERLYIGTDIGVYRSVDGGTNWVQLNNGLPNVVVTDLVFNSTTRTFVAATYGRSVYKLKEKDAIYVDGSWTGCENGSYQCPYNTLSEGVSAAHQGDELFIKAGFYTGVENVPATINKSLTIRNYGGIATIGSP
jgi:hypothetical protein